MSPFLVRKRSSEDTKERGWELEHKILALHHESLPCVWEECGIRQVPPLWNDRRRERCKWAISEVNSKPQMELFCTVRNYTSVRCLIAGPVRSIVKRQARDPVHLCIIKGIKVVLLSLLLSILYPPLFFLLPSLFLVFHSIRLYSFPFSFFFLSTLISVFVSLVP